MSKNFKVRHKVSNSIHEVYDIQYDNCGYPQFLIYENNQWVRVSAKHYKPDVNEKKRLFESNLKDKKYEYKFKDDM